MNGSAEEVEDAQRPKYKERNKETELQGKVKRCREEKMSRYDVCLFVLNQSSLFFFSDMLALGF